MLNKAINKYHQYNMKRYISGYLDQNKSLNILINDIKSTSDSTGVSISDYIILYEYIKKNKPKFVLECGTGMSTVIIAEAMKNFVLPQSPQAKFVSMESKKEWYNHQISIFPEQFNDFVEIVYSPIDTWNYSFVKGTVYKDVPDYPYEFVFVDGPSQGIEDVGGTMCNMDFVRVVEKTNKSITGIIDNRKHTVLAYTNIFGIQKVNYFSHWSLGFVQNVSKEDMILNDKTSMIKDVFPHLVQYNNKSFLKII